MSAPEVDAARLDQRAERLVDDRNALMRALIDMRKAHDLTQGAVAERMGVSQPTVAAFEHYDSNPTLATIMRYAMAVDAVISTTVIDDCEDAVPSEWSEPIEWKYKMPAPKTPKQNVTVREASYA